MRALVRVTAWEGVLLWRGPKMPKERDWVPFPTGLRLQPSPESSAAHAAQTQAVRAVHPPQGAAGIHGTISLPAETQSFHA